MTDEELNISSDIVMLLSGFFFGIGFGMLIGVYLL